MIEAIKEQFARFEPQAVSDTIIHLILDLLGAVLVLAAIYMVFRLSRRPLNMPFDGAGMHIKLVEPLGEVKTMPDSLTTRSMGSNSS